MFDDATGVIMVIQRGPQRLQDDDGRVSGGVHSADTDMSLLEPCKQGTALIAMQATK